MISSSDWLHKSFRFVGVDSSVLTVKWWYFGTQRPHIKKHQPNSHRHVGWLVGPTNQPTCLWDRDRSSKRSSNVLGSGHLLDRWERLLSSSFCSSDKSSSRTACIKSISLPIVMTNRRPNSAAVGYLTGDDSVAAFFATTSNWSILLQLTVCHIKEQTVQSILVKSGHEHSNRRHLHS